MHGAWIQSEGHPQTHFFSGEVCMRPFAKAYANYRVPRKEKNFPAGAAQ